MNEFEIIERCFGRGGGRRDDVLLGIGDDAALLALARDTRLACAQVTLFGDTGRSADVLARALVARALSRLVCVAALPCWATLALTLPGDDTDWLESFSTTLVAALAAHRVSLVGGDTTRGPPCATLAVHGTLVEECVPPPEPHAGDRLLLLDVLTGLVARPAAALAGCAPLLVACDGDARTTGERLATEAGLAVRWEPNTASGCAEGAILAVVGDPTLAASATGTRPIGVLVLA